MKAVIDTNVVMSGLFWKGPPANVLATWLAGKFEWVISVEILTEYDRTMRALAVKYPPPISAWAFLREIGLSANLTAPIPLAQQVCSDADDDKFIAAAISGNAKVIVSGDKALLRLHPYQEIQIIKPAPFLKML
jgi:putative PIN family toxin of toxin-antitoxin system